MLFTMSSAICFCSDQSKILSSGNGLILSKTSPYFLNVCSTSLLKTLRKKKILLLISNFSFPTVFSTFLEKFLPFSSSLKLSSTNSFSLEEFQICCLEKITRYTTDIVFNSVNKGTLFADLDFPPFPTIQHFLHFPQYFLPFQKEISIFDTSILPPANLFNLYQSKKFVVW